MYCSRSAQPVTNFYLEEKKRKKMNQAKKVSATKTKHYRCYTVREHERKMYERVYKFVCRGCDRVVERKSYAVCCPSYGNECNGKASLCRKGK